MNRRELTPYHRRLADDLKFFPDRSERQQYLDLERDTEQYKLAKEHIKTRVWSRIKPILPAEKIWELPIPSEGKTEKLVDSVLLSVFEKLPGQKDPDFLAREVLSEYNDLSKGNAKEKKSANDLVTETASELLQNPQGIIIAEKAWKTGEVARNGAQEPKEPFSKKVKEKTQRIIKDEWESITPDELAGIVRVYSNKDEFQEAARKSAEDLLTNYFKGPKSRNQRIDAYYNFVSGVLDLVGENEAFGEGMKIALYATDILPKKPGLAEQVLLLSLPYREDPKSLKKALVVNYVISQLRITGLGDLEKFYQARKDFVESPEAVEELRKKQVRVTREKGHGYVKELNDKMLDFFRTVASPLPKAVRNALKDIWPFDLAFDETDPLNQKFQKVQLQLASSKQTH
ncbi:MAG: hypothetical protein A3B41_04020 [Candidatus Levybacteria bacterium RIFCSPLOWO2_01_FULL_37_26]|nr:MAG: hypothetical protein A3E40_03465 [Candidatus Levybacteria bacterium RIFCSPHIGHO2_12_FULL_37_9]OGH39631.1 MAG: hypothetical protein A3B41_04020 [Candidatus Levybacteria bacterium RIFCSPLOWO2_01_FULL_37_26]